LQKELTTNENKSSKSLKTNPLTKFNSLGNKITTMK